MDAPHEDLRAAIMAGRRKALAATALEVVVIAASVAWASIVCRVPAWGLAVLAAAVLVRCGAALLLSERSLRRDGVPAPEGLCSRVAALAGRAGIEVPHVRVVRVETGADDALRRQLNLSVNACTLDDFTPGTTIVVGEHLLGALHEREEDAVLAHELGHAAHRMGPALTAVRVLAGEVWPIALWAAPLVALVLGEGGWRSVALLAFGLPVGLLIAFVLAATSRMGEYAADRTGAALVGSPVALASAVTRLELVRRDISDLSRTRARSMRDLASLVAHSGVIAEPAAPMDAAEVRHALELVSTRTRAGATHPCASDRAYRLLA